MAVLHEYPTAWTSSLWWQSWCIILLREIVRREDCGTGLSSVSEMRIACYKLIKKWEVDPSVPLYDPTYIWRYSWHSSLDMSMIYKGWLADTMWCLFLCYYQQPIKRDSCRASGSKVQHVGCRLSFKSSCRASPVSTYCHNSCSCRLRSSRVNGPLL